MPEDKQINFWELNINPESKIEQWNDSNDSNDSNNFKNKEKNTNTQSIMWQANQEITNTTKNNMINLDSINIQETKPEKTKKIKFGTDGRENKEKKHYHINYRKIFVLSFTTIIISALVSWFLYIYNDYIKNYSTTNIWEQTTISNSITKVKDIVNKYFYSEHNAYNDVNLNGIDGQNNLKKLIKSDTNYIQKKEILNNSVQSLSNSILINHRALDDTKKTITKNWFFPEEIWIIINDEQQIWSIQNSLLSLETIKFSSAISVFSYLDTFIDSLSKAIEISKDTIQKNTKNIIKRGEKDINLYITNCYLNPFEVNYECNIIDDFDKYYDITNDKYFDTKFFKELIHYTDIKLEQTELPSFNITFKKFDQNKDEITFDIDINTFKQDEIELAKKGVLSPHIFIFTNLINNLKQSKFIVWEGISTKNLQIDTKVIDIWFTQFVVHNSHKSFTLPIQKESEREISDFVNNKE